MGTHNALATAPSRFTINPAERPLATYMTKRTNTRQSPKPSNNFAVGRRCTHRNVNRLVAIAPTPIQHCCNRKGIPGSRVSNRSWRTAAKDVQATAALRSVRPKYHLAACGVMAGRLALLPTLWAALARPRACTSEWQKLIVAAATPTTSPYCNLVWRLFRTSRVSNTVRTIAKALPTRLKVPTSKCWSDMKLNMSPTVKRLVVMQKRQSMSGRFSCLSPFGPCVAVQPAPNKAANA
mmetsp:Transcript_49222/g.105231  ORF Transcript_49222/g.105231 Transcript_49222/m.105231 type:complete len:237 (+) Transcript_49222:232-942(+)